MFRPKHVLYKEKQQNKYMSEQFEMIAKTFQGLEEVLAEELTHLGANDIQLGRRMVSFTGDKELMYRANFELHTALRILKPIKHFMARDADAVYEAVKDFEWEQILTVDKTFSVDSVVFSNEFRHSKFVAYKVKDAIADYFMEKYNKRPSVRINNPELSVHIHIAENKCTLCLDSSGESLHRRGYRQEATEAPLNEVLAAGMVLLTGWKGECDFIDPMCGSGTLLIEAALIAKNMAPGLFRRKGFAFEKWADFDAEMLARIYNDDSKEKEFSHRIYGYDILREANQTSANNVKAAGFSKDITLTVRPIEDFVQPEEKAIIVTNPPYGERITADDLMGLYSTIGRKLKHEFQGNEAWVISYRKECFDQIGLRPAQRIELFNGPLECEFRKYELFSGKNKDFKTSLAQEQGAETGLVILAEEGETSIAPSTERAERTERRPAYVPSAPRENNGERSERSDEQLERKYDPQRSSFAKSNNYERKSFNREDKPFERREGKPFERREGSDRPFERRGDKPYEKRGDKPFEHRGGDRPFRSREDKPFERREGKPFERREGGDRPFERRSDKPYEKRGDKPFEHRGGDRPFRSREDKPFERREGKPFERREGGDRPFERRGDKPYEKRGDKPFEHRGGDRPFRSREDRPYSKPAEGSEDYTRKYRPRCERKVFKDLDKKD